MDPTSPLPAILQLIDYFGIAVFAISGVPGPLAALVAVAAGFALRGLAIARGWSLPVYRGAAGG